MTRTIFCKKYQKEMEGLDSPPYPGKKGKEIFDNVSKQAWREWLTYQTMLINEKHLNLMDISVQNYLQGEFSKFLAGETLDKVAGYTPPDS